ncbi:MAG: hypothetical protein G01um10143_662 [Parcubacteria group bacterium Gr01-1014_3]|nr:MAG: hypothetical protein G01um10143_662 [Parcubacteria group bacterium Gr01-1014_3]
MKNLVALSIMALVAVIAGVIFYTSRTPDVPELIIDSNQPSGNSVINLGDVVKLDKSLANSIIKSPFKITGEARGIWYFEASFPIKLLDGNGNQIAIAVAQAQDNWMTIELVPFEATLEFKAPATDTGTLVFQKDNPSGLPEHDADVRVSIRFR